MNTVGRMVRLVVGVTGRLVLDMAFPPRSTPLTYVRNV